MGFLDRYQLKVPLSEGDLGTTWSAEDRELGRPVVVAIAEADAPEEVQAELLRRGELLASIDHPALLRTLASGTNEEGAPYLVMEALQGQTLAERLADGPPIGIDLLIDMVSDVLEGLAAAHEAGVFHGDIEPGKVFLVGTGGHPVVKLIGLGLNHAWLRGGPVGDTTHDDAPTLRSLGCMSPEQARRELVADVASDVYSVGAVLYDALTGAPPHFLVDPEALRRAVASERAAPMHRRRRELAGALAGAIDRAISLPPGRRFPDASSMRRALRSALIVSPRARGLETVTGPRIPADTEDRADEISAPLGEGARGIADMASRAALSPVMPWGDEGTLKMAAAPSAAADAEPDQESVPLDDTADAKPQVESFPPDAEEEAAPDAEAADEDASDSVVEDSAPTGESAPTTDEDGEPGEPMFAPPSPDDAGVTDLVLRAAEPSALSESPRGGSARPAGLSRHVWIGAGVGVAALLALLLVLSLKGTDDGVTTPIDEGAGGAGSDRVGDDGEDGTDEAGGDSTEGGDDEPGDDSTESGEHEDGEDGPDESANTVRITLVGLPESARVTVGEDVVEGSVFELGRGSTPVVVRVEARGFHDRRIEVTPEADREIRVRLRRRGGGRPAALTDPGF